MVEISNASGSILAFDGRVLESFHRSANQRLHIRHITSIEVKEGRKGELQLNVRTEFTMLAFMNIPPDQRSKLDELVAEVEAARQ